MPKTPLILIVDDDAGSLLMNWEAFEWSPSARAAAASPRSSDFDRQLEAPALRYEAVSDDLCRFDRYPPYLMMKRRETALFGAGLENPYFRVGDGVAGAEITVEGRRCINYASYNYLDFSGDRRVNEAAAAIARYGTSVAAKATQLRTPSTPGLWSIVLRRPNLRHLRRRLKGGNKHFDCPV